MNKYAILIGGLIFSTCSVSNAGAHNEAAKASSGVHLGTVNGVISDSMCKGDHTAMIKGGHGTDAASCTNKCVKEGNKPVLVDKKDKIVYTFSNGKLARPFAGKSVSVTGHIDSDTKVIHIHQIKAIK